METASSEASANALVHFWTRPPSVAGREVDPVHELRSVAGIRHDGIGPAKGGKPVTDLASLGQCGFMFGLGTGNTGGAFVIAVDQEPASGKDFRIGGCRFSNL